MRESRHVLARRTTASLFLTLCAAFVSPTKVAESDQGASPILAETKMATVPQIQLDAGHPWRPPFGLERIGRPLVAVVEIAFDQQPLPECVLVGRVQGKEIARSARFWQQVR